MGLLDKASKIKEDTGPDSETIPASDEAVEPDESAEEIHSEDNDMDVDHLYAGRIQDIDILEEGDDQVSDDNLEFQEEGADNDLDRDYDGSEEAAEGGLLEEENNFTEQPDPGRDESPEVIEDEENSAEDTIPVEGNGPVVEETVTPENIEEPEYENTDDSSAPISPEKNEMPESSENAGGEQREDEIDEIDEREEIHGGETSAADEFPDYRETAEEPEAGGDPDISDSENIGGPVNNDIGKYSDELEKELGEIEDDLSPEADIAGQDNDAGEIIEDETMAVEDEEKETVSDTEKDEPVHDDIPVHDYLVLYEIEKEIASADTRSEVNDVILFSLMGQIGVSSSSILLSSREAPDIWNVIDSRGVSLEGSGLFFDAKNNILRTLIEDDEILDIEEYKDSPENVDEYYKYIGADARLLVPLFSDSRIEGIAMLGDKLSGKDYTEDEKEFLRFVGEASGNALKRVRIVEELSEKNEVLSRQVQLFENIQNFQNGLNDARSKDAFIDMVRDFMLDNNIESFALYRPHQVEDFLFAGLTENEDLLVLGEEKHQVSYASALYEYMYGSGESLRIEGFEASDMVREVFSENKRKKMNHFSVYPYKVGRELLGCTGLFRLKEGADTEIVHAVMKEVTPLISLHWAMFEKQDHDRESHVDSIEYMFKKIQNEINNASDIGIPLAIVLLSIKNYKRFYNLRGEQGVSDLMQYTEKLIRGRLSERDFSWRYDRHKVLLVLPGKDKKFALPLANTLRNEIVEKYSTRDIQLLMTCLIAEYPSDGRDVQELLDAVD